MLNRNNFLYNQSKLSETCLIPWVYHFCRLDDIYQEMFVEVWKNKNSCLDLTFETLTL